MLACVDLRVSICVCQYVCEWKICKKRSEISILFSPFLVKQSCRTRPQPVDTRISESYSKKEPHKRSSRDGSCHRAVVLYHWTRESRNSLDANSASSRGSNVGWHDACLLDVSVERRWCAEVSRASESEVQPSLVCRVLLASKKDAPSFYEEAAEDKRWQDFMAAGWSWRRRRIRVKLKLKTDSWQVVGELYLVQ